MILVKLTAQNTNPPIHPYHIGTIYKVQETKGNSVVNNIILIPNK